MVESISSVNGATPINAAAAVTNTTPVEETAKKEEQAKKPVEKLPDLENKADVANTKYDRTTLLNMVNEYIQNLKKTHDYPLVISRLDSYLFNFNIDKFMETYPNIQTEQEFKMIMYNETVKYL
ncbi:hypothetical protein IJG72_00160 [bacterium]|nr:hypothetical protein [bacterium]